MSRSFLRRALRLAAMALAALGGTASVADAQVSFVGILANDDCDALGTPPAPELIALKVGVGPAAASEDFLFDLGAKGGSSAGAAEVAGSQWSLPPNWKTLVAPADVVFAVVTAAPPDGDVAHLDSMAMPSSD